MDKLSLVQISGSVTTGKLVSLEKKSLSIVIKPAISSNLDGWSYLMEDREMMTSVKPRAMLECATMLN